MKTLKILLDIGQQTGSLAYWFGKVVKTFNQSNLFIDLQ